MHAVGVYDCCVHSNFSIHMLKRCFWFDLSMETWAIFCDAKEWERNFSNVRDYIRMCECGRGSAYKYILRKFANSPFPNKHDSSHRRRAPMNTPLKASQHATNEFVQFSNLAHAARKRLCDKTKTTWCFRVYIRFICSNCSVNMWFACYQDNHNKHSNVFRRLWTLVH